jgi:leucyl-tRNA synthetase
MNKYITVMAPYPSGSSLHCGHYYNYAIVDSYCKIQKYQGHEVFQPFSYDSFGLPTENYAIKIGRDVAEVSLENIESFRHQMEKMNTSFEEKFTTSSSDFIKKSQWLFSKLLEHGLAYKAEQEQCYCPSCKTILANEQVKNTKIVNGLPLDGVCERCSTPIEAKKMNQWFLKITDYAERLINDLDKVDYPEKIKKQQKHWIGKSEGYEIDFGNGIICFTTKPETLPFVDFIVVPLQDDGIEKQIGSIKHPLKDIEIPIWTADYVIKGYGTAYVMGVPRDDKRDASFSIRHNIPSYISEDSKDLINIREFNFIKPKTNYRLRDWSVSRQRKWGCPIPVEGETDTLDTFFDTAHYLIQYDKTRPVDIYVGGGEHACTHLIYYRFITKFLYDIGYIDFDEPIKCLINQGIILAEDGERMSKTRGNVINPISYDPQLLRMFMMFINHYFEGGKWQDAGYKGCERFRNKLMTWVNSASEEADDIDFDKFEKTVINYFESWKTNKVVSEWMIFFNTNKGKKMSINTAEKIKKFFNTCF